MFSNFNIQYVLRWNNVLHQRNQKVKYIRIECDTNFHDKLKEWIFSVLNFSKNYKANNTLNKGCSLIDKET